MIILNEANKLKKFIAKRSGIKLPKGGTIKNISLYGEKSRKIRDGERNVRSVVKQLLEPYNPNDKYAWHQGKEYAYRHGLPISLTTNKPTLHARINNRAKGYNLKSSRSQRHQMYNEYEDKLTHKYNK